VREAGNTKSAPSALDKGSLIDGVPGTSGWRLAEVWTSPRDSADFSNWRGSMGNLLQNMGLETNRNTDLFSVAKDHPSISGG
jgi:hypothetical protein